MAPLLGAVNSSRPRSPTRYVVPPETLPPVARPPPNLNPNGVPAGDGVEPPNRLSPPSELASAVKIGRVIVCCTVNRTRSVRMVSTNDPKSSFPFFTICVMASAVASPQFSTAACRRLNPSSASLVILPTLSWPDFPTSSNRFSIRANASSYCSALILPAINASLSTSRSPVMALRLPESVPANNRSSAWFCSATTLASICWPSSKRRLKSSAISPRRRATSSRKFSNAASLAICTASAARSDSVRASLARVFLTSRGVTVRAGPAEGAGACAACCRLASAFCASARVILSSASLLRLLCASP